MKNFLSTQIPEKLLDRANWFLFLTPDWSLSKIKWLKNKCSKFLENIDTSFFLFPSIPQHAFHSTNANKYYVGITNIKPPVDGWDIRLHNKADRLVAINVFSCISIRRPFYRVVCLVSVPTRLVNSYNINCLRADERNWRCVSDERPAAR